MCYFVAKLSSKVLFRAQPDLQILAAGRRRQANDGSVSSIYSAVRSRWGGEERPLADRSGLRSTRAKDCRSCSLKQQFWISYRYSGVRFRLRGMESDRVSELSFNFTVRILRRATQEPAAALC